MLVLVALTTAGCATSAPQRPAASPAPAAPSVPPLPSPAEVADFLVASFGAEGDIHIAEAFAHDPPTVEALDLEATLQRHTLFRACTEIVSLEYLILPSSITCGTFVTDGQALVYLGADKHPRVEALLARDRTPLHELPPAAVAALLARLLLDGTNVQHTVVSSVADIDGKVSSGSGYVLDASERPAYEARLHPPAVSGDAQQGWTAEFVTLSGWMHDTRTLTRYRVRITPEHRLTLEPEVLSSGVYSEVPGIDY